MTDGELAKRAQRGNPEAFMELIHRYQNQVYRLAYRFSGSTDGADDLCQECFLKAFRNIGKFDTDKPFLPWIMRLAANTFVNQARGTSRRRMRECELVDEDAILGMDMEREVIGRMDRERVLQAVQDLPEQTRVLVLMRFVSGLSFREIAEQTQTKLPTVAFRISRGLQKLRAVLEPEFGKVDL